VCKWFEVRCETNMRIVMVCILSYCDRRARTLESGAGTHLHDQSHVLFLADI